MNKEQLYDTEIAPLLLAAGRKADEYDIPMRAVVFYGEEGELGIETGEPNLTDMGDTRNKAWNLKHGDYRALTIQHDTPTFMALTIRGGKQ